jgi:hypothetical protein
VGLRSPRRRAPRIQRHPHQSSAHQNSATTLGLFKVGGHRAGRRLARSNSGATSHGPWRRVCDSKVDRDVHEELFRWVAIGEGQLADGLSAYTAGAEKDSPLWAPSLPVEARLPDRGAETVSSTTFSDPRHKGWLELLRPFAFDEGWSRPWAVVQGVQISLG